MCEDPNAKFHPVLTFTHMFCVSDTSYMRVAQLLAGGVVVLLRPFTDAKRQILYRETSLPAQVQLSVPGETALEKMSHL